MALKHTLEVTLSQLVLSTSNCAQEMGLPFDTFTVIIEEGLSHALAKAKVCKETAIACRGK